MKHKNVTRNALFTSIVSLLVCLSMLVGTTFAWFTDSVESGNNIITSGNLDVAMYWADGTEAVPTDDAGWTDASTGAIFDYDKWEPGYTEVRHIKIANEGSLALKYQLIIQANGEVSDLADVIDVYFVDPAEQIADRTALAGMTPEGNLTAMLGAMPGNTSGSLAAGQEVMVTLAMKMQETAGNQYMEKSIGANFSVVLLATQVEAEDDSFGPDYDKDAVYSADISISKAVEDTDGDNKIDEAIELIYNDRASSVTAVQAQIPAGAVIEDDVDTLILTIKEQDAVNPNVTVATDKQAVTYEIDVIGLAADNDQPVTVTMTVAKGLSGVKLYHNATEIPCTYDAVTGKLTFQSADFSPFTLVYNKEAEPGLFAGGTGTAEDPYIISNREQLLKIADLYDTYNYYKIADGVTEIDCSGWPKTMKLNGSFDGNGVTLNNLSYSLFYVVGVAEKQDEIVIKNLTANMNNNTGSALVRNIYNYGKTTFENVTLHGTVEGSYNMGSFYNYGTANADLGGASYEVEFKNAKSDLTLICTSGNVMGGMLGHGYEGSGNTLTITMDENSGYTGAMYTKGNLTCNGIMAMCSNGTFVLNGETISRYSLAKYPSQSLNTVAPVKGENGYTIAKQDGAAYYIVSVHAQVTEYLEDGFTMKPNANGLTMVLSSSKLDATDGVVLGKVDSVEIVNEYQNGNLGYALEGGVLKAYVGNRNALSGNITLQVVQFNAEGNILSTGVVTLGTVAEPKPECQHEGGEATCKVLAVCEKCGESYGEVNPENHEHTEVRDRVEATFEKPGYTGDTYCLDCGEKIADGEEIPVAICEHEHTEIKNAVAATCGAAGYTGDTFCNDCQKVVETGAPIPATGNHERTEVRDRVEATFEKPGYTGDTYCLDCGEKIADGEEIPVATCAHEHTELKNAVAATCGAAGYTGDTFCLDCQKVVKKGETDPATDKHVDADGKWEFDGENHFHTCACGAEFDVAAHEGGVAYCTVKAKCSVCDNEHGRFDYSNHTGEGELTGYKAATHEAGYTGDLICEDCNQGDPIKVGDVIPGHCICGGNVEGTEHHTCDTNVEWIAWTEEDSLPTADGNYYYLTKHVKLATTVKITEGTLNLCLNGKTITGAGQVFETTNCTLNITDCTGEGTITSTGEKNNTTNTYGGVINVKKGSVLNVYGGTIYGTTAYRGGTIAVQNTGVMNLYAGTITGGTPADRAGNIDIFSGTDGNGYLNMYGGTISKGVAKKSGGGNVNVQAGTFKMYGGTITDGTASGLSGGNIRVANNGVMEMYGGSITGGTAKTGNDVYWTGSFTQTGGEISTAPVEG